MLRLLEGGSERDPLLEFLLQRCRKTHPPTSHWGRASAAVVVEEAAVEEEAKAAVMTVLVCFSYFSLNADIVNNEPLAGAKKKAPPRQHNSSTSFQGTEGRGLKGKLPSTKQGPSAGELPSEEESWPAKGKTAPVRKLVTSVKRGVAGDSDRDDVSSLSGDDSDVVVVKPLSVARGVSHGKAGNSHLAVLVVRIFHWLFSLR